MSNEDGLLILFAVVLLGVFSAILWMTDPQLPALFGLLVLCLPLLIKD